jgi:zinc transporter ZupT
MPLTDWARAAWAVLEEMPARQEAWAAVLIVCASTLVGAWLARRSSRRMTLWLAIASATMLVTALVDLLPDAWSEAVRTGVPLWALVLAASFGFLVIAYFTRKGCACPSDGERQRAAMHAPGRHRRVKQAVDAALFGGMGTAAALTLHRAIEGATLGLTASVVVVFALTIHSASEGLALAALLDMARQRVAPWLLVACASPAAGVLIASVAPLPDQLVPILLSLVMGVLLRTAVVGMKLAAGGQQDGRLSRRQIAIAVTAATSVGVLLVTAHTFHGEDEPEQAAPTFRHAMAAFPAAAQAHILAAPPEVAHAERSGALSATPLAGTQEPSAAGRFLDRHDLRAAVTSGKMSLGDVLERHDATTGRAAVGRIIRLLPGYLPERVDSLIASTGVDEKRHIADLTPEERRKLLSVFDGYPE